MGRGQHQRKRQRRPGRGHRDRVTLKRSAATAIILVSAAGFAVETGRDSYSAPRPHSIDDDRRHDHHHADVDDQHRDDDDHDARVASNRGSLPQSRPWRSIWLTRTDNVTAALYNVTTGQTFVYRPGIRQVTASMVKIDILAVLALGESAPSRLAHRASSSLWPPR